MKLKYIIISIITFAFIIIGGILFLMRGEITARISLNEQINHIITYEDIVSAKKISNNTETLNFIMNLPQKTKCKNTSNYQGVNKNGEYYYVTMLNDRKINVYMQRDNRKGILRLLFPKWEVKNIELQK